VSIFTTLPSAIRAAGDVLASFRAVSPPLRLSMALERSAASYSYSAVSLASCVFA